MSHRLPSVLVAVCLVTGCGEDEPLQARSGSAGTDGAVTSSCPAQANGIEVADRDLEGYPPYAIDGCRLLYVSASSGELVLRDLESGAEQTLAPRSEEPQRPALAGELSAWQAVENLKSVVRVRYRDTTRTLSGSFDHASEPRACADAVVFSAFSSASDSDVYLYRPESESLELVAGGPGQQRFSDVSTTHVAVSDFSEDPSGVYSGDGTSLADLLLVDRSSGLQRRLQAAGKQAFPMLGASARIAYLEWVGIHPVPKLQEYAVRITGLDTFGTIEPRTLANVTNQRSTVRPVARADFVEWVERPQPSGSLLYRARADLSAPSTVVAGLEGLELFAPAASNAITVIAARNVTGGPSTLHALER